MPLTQTHINQIKSSLSNIENEDFGVISVVEKNLSPEVYHNADEALSEYFNHYGYSEKLANDHHAFRLVSLACKEYRLAVQLWQKPDARATVFVFHGLFDHAGIYLPLVRALLDANYSVVVTDMPGHGLSTGDEACINDFADYAYILDAILGTFIPILPPPFFGLGQSTGGAALMRYLLAHPATQVLNAGVLFAPLIQPRAFWSVSLAHSVMKRFISRYPRTQSINSHDEKFIDFLKHGDPLQPKSISVRWIGAMRRWVAEFESFHPCDLPTLIVQGDQDRTVDWERNLPRIERQFPAHETLIIEGGLHHLVNEGEHWQSQAFAATIDFLNRMLAKPSQREAEIAQALK